MCILIIKYKKELDNALKGIYHKKDAVMSKKKLKLDVSTGFSISFTDGYLVSDSPYCMATEFFYPVSKGDYIKCLREDYVFAVMFYAKEREEQYIYTYDYKTDAAWLRYRKELTRDSYSQETCVFTEEGYCRISIKRTDGMELKEEDADHIDSILAFYTEEKMYQAKVYFEPEIEDTAEKVNVIWRQADSKSNKDSKTDSNGVNGKDRTEGVPVSISDELLTLVLLTDSHYTVNGTWEDTADNIKKVVSALNKEEDFKTTQTGYVKAKDLKETFETVVETRQKVNAIVHLGDFTDGMTSKKVTSFYTEKMLRDLMENELPVYTTLGNHDFNYFRGNKHRFTWEEQSRLFGLEQEYYYRDFTLQKLRCLFLSSYNINTPVRYGFSDEEILWVEKTLDDTPQGYKVLIFSHEAPLDLLDYWARIIRNGKKLMQILEDYNIREDAQILAYIHGHTHAEYIYRGSSFPIISIGCNKCEYFPEKKPEGSHIYKRVPDTVTQDLWDVLLVDSSAEQLHFVRFGAGKDRVVDCKKTESTWRRTYLQKKRARKTKIWAHRGSSGFAPENTLPSFAVAKELDVDGVTLNVRMTKDGHPVVISDETIDRTSNGTGYVKDFTLKQLRQFNFAQNKPSFGFVEIPTLQEVYELFQDTDMILYVEEKDSEIQYDDAEGNSGAAVYDDMEVRKGKILYNGRADMVKPQGKTVHLDITCSELEKRIRKYQEKGIQVCVWNVNEKEDALRLYEMGVDIIVTDHPGKMRELYYEAGKKA